MRTTFRASTAVLPLAFLLLASAGCVKMSSDINIDAKGGGTASMSVSISSEVLAALDEMGKMGGGQETPDLPDFDTIDRAYLEKRAGGHGVTVTKFNKTEAGGRKSLDLAVAFNDLKGMSWVLHDLSAAGSGGDGLGLFAATDGNLELRPAHYDFPAVEKKPAPAPTQPTPEQMQKQMELAGKLMGAISEMDVTMRFTVPGDIVTSNAPKVEGRTSIWTVNAGNMMEAQSDMSPHIVFSGKGLNIKAQTE